jgi:hypothetical protein
MPAAPERRMVHNPRPIKPPREAQNPPHPRVNPGGFGERRVSDVVIELELFSHSSD